jgi:putative ABC transport system permease protein
MLIERASLDFIGANVGDVVLIETPDGQRREIRIAGLVHDPSRLAAAVNGVAYGYITPGTLEWLGQPRYFDVLHIIVARNALDREHIQHVANQVRDKVEKGGRAVGYLYVPPPGAHPASDIVQALVLVLGALGLLSLFLSGFLVANTLSALLAQQVRQVGVMKAIGARAHQIVGVYLGYVLVFGLLALVVAVPLGVLGAHALAGFVTGILNVDIASFHISSQVLALQVAVGLAVPLLAALYPIVAGTRVTVREAISTYGLGKGRFGTSIVDRLLERVRGLPRPLLLSLRNTFRRKGRLTLTLATLALGGAMFIAVFSVHASLLLTLEDVLRYSNYDIMIEFSRLYRVERLEREAPQVPGVVAVESRGLTSVRRRRPDGSESGNILTEATPAKTGLFQPAILQGRWLLPEDENALIIDTEMLKVEPDVKVGDEIVLVTEGRETTWRVVGLIRAATLSIPPVPVVYVNQPYFARVMHSVGRASSLVVQTERHDAASQAEIAQALEERFESAGLHVGAIRTISEVRTGFGMLAGAIAALLFIMAILLAVVGGLGLMGTMSLNVLERTREIGVMRAIGASNLSVLRIVMGEGVTIGVLSWFVGTLLAFPLSKFLSDAVGIAFLQAPLSYTFSASSVLIWLVVVVILAALASFLPAWNAARLTVREVLAYE